MSSIFGELDVASAEVVTGNKPAGPQRAVVVKDELMRGSKNDPDYLALVITYEIENQPFEQTEYLSIPQIGGRPARPDAFPTEPRDAKGRSPQDYAAMSLGQIKKRLLSLGVPEDKINSVQPGDLTGVRCIVTLGKDRKNPDFTRVASVELPSGVEIPSAVSSSPLGGAAPTASPPATSGNPFA